MIFRVVLLFSPIFIVFGKEDTYGAEPKVFSSYSELYLLSNHKKLFFEADRQCKKHGLILATIHDASQQTQLINFIKKSNANANTWLWLGGSDLAMKDHNPYFFYWVDSGEAFTYSNWHPKRPHKDNVSCLAIHTGNYLWYDQYCTAKYGFICMHPLYALKRD